MTELNPIIFGHKCKRCGKWHDMFRDYHGENVCINCWFKLKGITLQ